MHVKYGQSFVQKMLTHKQQLYEGVRWLEVAQSRVYGRAFPKSAKYFWSHRIKYNLFGHQEGPKERKKESLNAMTDIKRIGSFCD
jgi:hypothetical protein